MRLRKMIIRTFRVWLGKWHYERFLRYEKLIRNEQESTLKGQGMEK